MGETYYDVLGVSPDATREEIEAAYRERVLETHPDQNDDPDAAAAFDRVTTAEAVLTDEAERARYDRLGHDAYVRLAESGGDAGRGPRSSDPFDPDAAAWASAGGTGSQTRSHHARQRRRRRRSTEEPAGGTGRREANTGDGTAGFAVHDWEEEVEVGRERPPLDRTTAVVAGSIAVLYPVLVLASVTPAFPLPVNVVVAVATLALVAYLLTLPTIATVAFGTWSLLVPIGLAVVADTSPVSALGLVTIAAFWIPFGYALAVRWALRP